MRKLKILIIDASQFIEFRCVRFLKEKHEVQICISLEALDNIIGRHPEELDYFDLIFIEPYFPNGKKYGYRETNDALQTGWFIYRDFLKDLAKAKIAVITHPTEQYVYSERNFPGRSWGENMVGLFRKNGTDDDFLINLAEQLCA
jgi:hypothetical protein